MLHRKILSAGILLLSVFCSGAFAQTHIKKNAASPTDSVVVELPHNTKMILVLDDINKLKLLEKTNLDSLVKALNQQLQESNAIPSASAPKIGYTGLGKQSATPDTAKSTDQLVLWASVGVGLVRNEFVPQLAPGLELRIKDKAYFVHYDMNFFFDRNAEGKYNMHLNSFLDVGIGFKPWRNGMINSTDADHFRRVSVGYLIQQNGGYFERNTFRLSYSYPILDNKIKVMPQLYFTDNFKTMFPGVSLRF